MSANVEPRKAAVSLIQREDGRVLCVWNLRYEGFSLPGGMVEDGETVEAALRRELREETSLEVEGATLIFEGSHNLRPKSGDRGGRASVVALYRVMPSGEPREVEAGCRVEWLTWEEFLAQSPFSAFYRSILPTLPRTVNRALAIACPKCEALPGEPCHGTHTANHRERTQTFAQSIGVAVPPWPPNYDKACDYCRALLGPRGCSCPRVDNALPAVWFVRSFGREWPEYDGQQCFFSKEKAIAYQRYLDSKHLNDPGHYVQKWSPRMETANERPSEVRPSNETPEQARARVQRETIRFHATGECGHGDPVECVDIIARIIATAPIKI